MTQLNQKFTLPDGRQLGYDEYGFPIGEPIIYFHGTPSSRLESQLFVSLELVDRLEVRLIVPDRPGMGLSSFQAGRRMGDWPGDVLSLADHLALERFSVLGYSGGGPYAAACARSIPERLSKVGIVSGAGPFDYPGLPDDIHPDSRRFMDLARDRPGLSRLLIRMMALMARYAGERVVANAIAALPAPDQQVMSNPALQSGFLKMLLEALRQGPRGTQHDTRLMVTPWDFRPQDIRFPVHLWHGGADRNAPPDMGRYMADSIQKSSLQFYPGEGHISLFSRHAQQIFQFLANWE